MFDGYFKKTKVKLNLLQFPEIQNLNDREFLISPYDSNYVLLSNDVKDYVRSIIPLPPSKPKEIIFQVLKNNPNSVYEMHKDAIRFCAINTLISTPNDDHIFEMEDDDGNRLRPNYNGNQFVPYLINVEQTHGVWNKSPTDNRYILTIGFFTKEFDYKFMYDWFTKCGLI